MTPTPTWEEFISSQAVSDYFGISNHVFWIGIGVALIAAVYIAFFFYFRNFLLSTFVTIPIFAIGVWMGLLPLWLVVIYLVFAVYMIFSYSSGSDIDMPTTEPSSDGYSDKWIKYGQGLKDAYTSKFGGENLGFNDEVDKRISVMQHNGRGMTRALAKGWLKRMHKFTESK